MTISRRFFLKGMGATVAIPVLPSLLTPAEARAQAVTPRPCFAAFSTNHGGIWASNMFPAAPANAETATYAGRTARRFQLVATRSGDGLARISPVLTAAEGTLTAALVGKMFTVQGFGIPWYIAHHTGGCLGNYAANCGHAGAEATSAPARRTIDQVMGWSSAFYSPADLGAVRLRAMVTAERASYNHSNPADRTGAIQPNSAIDTPNQLFDALFPQQGTPAQRPPIVDRVREAYQRMRTSPRISRADRDRLDAHIQRLDEVKRRLDTVVQCGAVARPTNPSMGLSLGDVSNASYLDPGAHALYHQAFNDIFVLAFSCGVSRIAVNRIDLLFSDYAGDWHQDVAHQYDVPARQQILTAAQQRVFANVIVDLASKLDAVSMGDGTTLLDRTLVTWAQESGNQTHDSTTIPVVCFGGAQGFLRTGHHLDYRNLSLPFVASETNKRYGGLVWNQWLGTILQAMRIPRSEWENAAVCAGYPDHAHANLQWCDITTEQAWPAAVWSAAGEVPPWLAA